MAAPLVDSSLPPQLPASPTSPTFAPSPLSKSITSSSFPTKTAEEEDHVASFKRMLDDILDGSSESLSHGLDTGLHSRIGGSSFLSSSSAASRARLNTSTTLGYLLPQPKGHFSKLKNTHGRTELSDSAVDVDLLHKLEEQNSLLPPQDSTSFLLARLERQNGLLDTDPKSICIESNVLKGNLSTLHRLIADSTTLNAPNSDAVDPMSSTNAAVLEHQAGDEEIDWEFWGMLVQDYNAVASKLPHLLSARVRQGLPSKLRGLIWQSMSQASSTYLETMYTQLLKEHSPYERIIQRDLARTFPQIDMFKEEGGKGQEMLGNILKAYSLYDPHVGYCQGLGFLVGPLLMNMDEKEAFCVFVRLMETYDMRTMFTLNMEGLQLRLYQFSALLSEHLPMLHAHLSFHAIHAAMYASQWFLSLFAYTYPLPLVLRIYDVVFTEGAPETIMRVAVAFLKKNEEKLMQLQEFEDLLEALSTNLYDVYEDNAGSVIKDAMALSSEISKDKLDALAMAYLAELEDQQKRTEEVTSKRFRDRFGSSKAKTEEKPVAKPAVVKDKLKRGSSRLSIAASFGSSASIVLNDEEETESNAQARSNASDTMLLEQIQDLAKALSTLQKDHVEVTEGLVTAKLEKMHYMEEMENLRKKLADMERQQNRASMMSAISPSVMSQSDTASTMIMSSPRTLAHEDGKMREQPGRPSSSWSDRSRDEDDEDRPEIETKASSISSIHMGYEELASRLAATERELSHVTGELVHAKVSVMEAMNEVESQRQKTQTIESVLMDSKEALVMLQDQQVLLQNSKMAMAMEMDGLRHERDMFERDMNVMRQQFDETKRLWLEGQVERHSLQEKVKELEMNAAFAASTSSLGRGRSVRKSLGEATMLSLMTSRPGSPSPRASTQMTSVSEDGGLRSPGLERRTSNESMESASRLHRGSSETMTSTQSGRESTSSVRPANMVRKGWPSEKAASAGVVPTSPVSSTYGTRKFMIATDGEATKLKRSQSTRNSMFGALSFRRSTSEAS
ncbi:MAG: rab-GTPase-TBC domain-containing protein [Podila humilis]|nr:MAG: rab-GTPase-TBC domain-containing protein [Podila humilis]